MEMYIAPLEGYYSEALSTLARLKKEQFLGYSRMRRKEYWTVHNSKAFLA